jgi:hypothetical protein
MIFPINYAGGVPHSGYPVAHFGNPAQQGQADVIHVPCTGAGRGTTTYAIRDLVPVKS